MKNIADYLQRNRNYHRHEKWGVFAALAIVTLAVWSSQNLWAEGAPASANTLLVQNVSVPSTIDMARIGGDLSVIALVDKRTNQPAQGVWVGLRVKDASKRTPELTYYDWYSPHPERAFYPTNDLGLVYFPLESKIAGQIDYDIYVGNPELKTGAKYQKLDKSFSVEYR
jgi:hypothetical protein